jgi:DNA-binding CsgD family transcriptional regulator
LLADYRTQTDSLGILLAKAGFGVILITREGQLIYANEVAKALLSLRRGLCRAKDRIIAVDFEANQKLQQLISGERHRSGVLLREKGSGESYVIRVVPILPKTCNFLEYDILGLLIWCRDQRPADRVRIISVLFDLTPSETRVLVALMSGKGVAYAARQLNITELTARTHLKHIMDKTDTHRQAQLIRLVFQLTIPSDRLRQPTLSCIDTAHSATR